MGTSEKQVDLNKAAKIKAARFCAYRERTQREVRQKLHGYGLLGDDAETVIAELITEGFINEERYAISYASGKFGIKKWGKLKIQQGLERQGLTDYYITKALTAIPPESYHQTLMQLLEKKWQALPTTDIFVKKHKTAKFLLGKGYEPDIVWSLLNERKK